MSRKFYLCIIISIIILFTALSTKCFAEDTPIIDIGGEKFPVKDFDQTNSKSTATYSATNKTLTLNNYDGGYICYYGDEALTIILQGENKITSEEYAYNGIETWAAGLTIKGEGSLKYKMQATEFLLAQEI